MSDIQTLILSAMLTDSLLAKSLMPHMKPELFESKGHAVVYQVIHNHITTYNSLPTKVMVQHDLSNLGCPDTVYREAGTALEAALDSEHIEAATSNHDWFLKQTEAYCRDRAVYLAITNSIKVIDGEMVDGKRLEKGAIPKMLQDALNISFSVNIGHDYLDDAEMRWALYNEKLTRFPTGLNVIDDAMNGGPAEKTCNVLLGGCVHPDTKVKIRRKLTSSTDWVEAEVCMSDIKNLLKDGFDVEIFSEDGFQPVTHFVDKGLWDEYVLTTEAGRVVRVNERHLFETTGGWRYAMDMLFGEFEVITENGVEKASVVRTGRVIPIVDIQVDHPNHRYYAEGVSSHNTNIGKSYVLCSLAAEYISKGTDVLYVTCEMPEHWIAERIDSNLMDVDMSKVQKMSNENFMNKIAMLRRKVKGRLKIKEYPTGTCTANHIRLLLEELSMKQDFRPKVLIVDYIGILASGYLKSKDNMFLWLKNIAEELRALAMEKAVCIWTAAQSNRDGQDNQDPTLENVGESHGLSTTVDWMGVVVRSDQHDQMKQIRIKQLKSRYANKEAKLWLTLGSDIDYMRLFNLTSGSAIPAPMPASSTPVPKAPQASVNALKAVSSATPWVV